ncbi:hemerythrin domain-containing protein [Pleomorphovibrio marinus]|uniref:hemerythrin domain-containing protein n=1 Tax=Pleomorphovibrio marinus TaxID=2164132 RepID=UPI000E0C5740|nr:hemerythrin domain-containing protein [Pleomorphovibrio marinus]
MSIPQNIFQKSIGVLVEENHVMAAVLHYFGISFFNFEQETLANVCGKFKINPKQVMEELEAWAMSKEPSQEELFLHPIEVLVEYLKKKHRVFVRQELPFLSNMVSGINAPRDYKCLLEDMRLMFPLFVDDFIHHIHEEENTLFERIQFLQAIEKGEVSLQKAVKIFSVNSIMALATEHEAHDDEMEGIRKLTSNYSLPPEAPMAMRILYLELQKLEKELVIHAKIENDLLFPKAVELEKEVKRAIILKAQSN